VNVLLEAFLVKIEARLDRIYALAPRQRPYDISVMQLKVSGGGIFILVYGYQLPVIILDPVIIFPGPPSWG